MIKSAAAGKHGDKKLAKRGLSRRLGVLGISVCALAGSILTAMQSGADVRYIARGTSRDIDLGFTTTPPATGDYTNRLRLSASSNKVLFIDADSYWTTDVAITYSSGFATQTIYGLCLEDGWLTSTIGDSTLCLKPLNGTNVLWSTNVTVFETVFTEVPLTTFNERGDPVYWTGRFTMRRNPYVDDAGTGTVSLLAEGATPIVGHSNMLVASYPWTYTAELPLTNVNGEIIGPSWMLDIWTVDGQAATAYSGLSGRTVCITNSAVANICINPAPNVYTSRTLTVTTGAQDVQCLWAGLANVEGQANFEGGVGNVVVTGTTNIMIYGTACGSNAALVGFGSWTNATGFMIVRQEGLTAQDAHTSRSMATQGFDDSCPTNLLLMNYSGTSNMIVKVWQNWLPDTNRAQDSFRYSLLKNGVLEVCAGTFTNNPLQLTLPVGEGPSVYELHTWFDGDGNGQADGDEARRKLHLAALTLDGMKVYDVMSNYEMYATNGTLYVCRRADYPPTVSLSTHWTPSIATTNYVWDIRRKDGTAAVEWSNTNGYFWGNCTSAWAAAGSVTGREFVARVWSDWDADCQTDPAHAAKTVSVVVVDLDVFKLTNNVQDLTFTNEPSGTNNTLFLQENATNGTAAMGMTLTWLPATVPGSLMMWKITDLAGQPSSQWTPATGRFTNSTIPVVWTNAAGGQSNRDFKVTAWFDCNTNGLESESLPDLEPRRQLFVSVLKLDIQQTGLNTFWSQTNAMLNLTADSRWGASGVSWSGTNGLNVLSWGNTNLVFSPSNSVATNYTVRATALNQTNCTDTAVVNVFRVDAKPDSSNSWYLAAGNSTLYLTNSYCGTNGISWTGTNGLKVVTFDNSTLVYTPSNSAATNYAVRAAIKGYTNQCFDVSQVAVYKVDIQQSVTNTFWAMTNSSLNLSAGCYWGTNGVIWTGTNGLKVLNWSSTNLVFSPSNSVATSYVVRAAAAAQTNWYDTATVNVFSVNIVPTSTNVNWLSAANVGLNFTNSYTGTNGITWSGTNGLRVVAFSSTNLTFTPTNSAAGSYLVKAALTGYTNQCYDVCTVGVYRVDIFQTNVYALVGSVTNAALFLSPGCSTNISWKITPDLGTNGVYFSTSSTNVGTTNLWSGTNVWVWPGKTDQVYTIMAYVNDLTNYFDTCTIRVVRVDLIHAEGADIGKSMKTVPVFTPLSGVNAGAPIYYQPAADLTLAFAGSLSSNTLDTINVSYLGTNSLVTETGTNTLMFNSSNSSMSVFLSVPPLCDTNVQEFITAVVSMPGMGISNAVYECNETNAASLNFENTRYGLIITMSGLNSNTNDTMDIQIIGSTLRSGHLTETTTNSHIFTQSNLTVRVLQNAVLTTNADTLSVSISDGGTMSNTNFRVTETGSSTLIFRNFADSTPTSLPDIPVPDFASWRVKVYGISDSNLVTYFALRTANDTNTQVTLSTVASLVSAEKFVLVPKTADMAALPSGYSAVKIDHTLLNWKDDSATEVYAEIQLVAMAGNVRVAPKKVEADGVVLESFGMIETIGQGLDPETRIRAPFKTMGYSMLRDYSASTNNAISKYIKGRQIWYSNSHGVTVDGTTKTEFAALGFKDGQILPSHINGLGLNYKLVIIDGCCSAQTSTESRDDAKTSNSLTAGARTFAEAFGANASYVGWGWEMSMAGPQVWTSELVNNLIYTPGLGRGRTVQEAYDLFIQRHDNPNETASKLMKVYRNTGNIIDPRTAQ